VVPEQRSIPGIQELGGLLHCKNEEAVFVGASLF